VFSDKIRRRFEKHLRGRAQNLANKLVVHLLMRGLITEYPAERHENERNGRIIVIAGEMFSGKTDELIRLIRRNVYAKVPFVVFKPAKDSRTANVWCRNGHELESIPVKSSLEILEYVAAHPEIKVVGIDEAQFFGMDDPIVEVVRTLADKFHIVVFVAGLDMMFDGRPFNQMPFLMAAATEVHKVHAVCVVCGRTAAYSRRKVASTDEVLVDDIGNEQYEAVCRRHRPF